MNIDLNKNQRDFSFIEMEMLLEHSQLEGEVCMKDLFERWFRIN